MLKDLYKDPSIKNVVAHASRVDHESDDWEVVGAYEDRASYLLSCNKCKMAWAVCFESLIEASLFVEFLANRKIANHMNQEIKFLAILS